MVEVGIIAANTLREIRSRKIIYFALFLAVLFGYSQVASMMFTRSLEEADEILMAGRYKRQSIAVLIQGWAFFASALALFLGAMSIATEAKLKTLAAVLARPVQRWQFLLGKWLGYMIFLTAFASIGVGFAILIGWYHDISFPRLFWIGLGDVFVRLLFFSGVSMGLSVFMNPTSAGCTAFFLTIFAQWTKQATHHPVWKWPANLLYYLCPADMPDNLVAESLLKEVLTPDYTLYAKILAENTLYAVAIFVLGCVFFARRDVQVK